MVIPHFGFSSQSATKTMFKAGFYQKSLWLDTLNLTWQNTHVSSFFFNELFFRCISVWRELKQTFVLSKWTTRSISERTLTLKYQGARWPVNFTALECCARGSKTHPNKNFVNKTHTHTKTLENYHYGRIHIDLLILLLIESEWNTGETRNNLGYKCNEWIKLSKWKILPQLFLELREREMDLSCSLMEFQNLGPLDLTLNLQSFFSMSNTSPVYISLISCLPEKLLLYKWAW